MFRLELPVGAWLFSIGDESWCPRVPKPFFFFGLALPCLLWYQISPQQLHGIGMGRAYGQSFCPQLGPPLCPWATAKQTHSPPPFFVVLLISDSTNPEKEEFRKKGLLVPLIKKRMEELMIVLGRTFKLKKYCFGVPQKFCFTCR